MLSSTSSFPAPSWRTKVVRPSVTDRWLAVTFLALSLPATAWGTPSFEKTMAVPVPVDPEGKGSEKVNITIHQDHSDPTTFYYLPRKPRLALTQRGKKTMPRYRFQRFQFRDPKGTGFLEGAILQFAVTLELTDPQLVQIQDWIKTNVKVKMPDPADASRQVERLLDSAEIKLKQIPIRSSTIDVYDPKGQRIGTSRPADLSPTTLTSEIPFTIQMDVIDAQLAEALAEGTTGLSCCFRYNYEVISEPAGFKVTVDWDQTFSHFSKSTETAEKMRSGWWIFSWETGRKYSSSLEVVNELQKNSCIKVDVTNNSIFTAEKSNAYLQPILDAINKELMGDTPPNVDPAKAAEATADSAQGITVSSTNEQTKNIRFTKKGRQEWNFNAREVFALSNPAQGFVEVGEYLADTDLKPILVPPTVTDGTNFLKSYISLPVICTSKEQGITSIELQIIPTDGKSTEGKNETVTWTPTNPEQGGFGKWSRRAPPGEAEVLEFGLDTFKAKLGDDFRKKMMFRVTTTVNYKIESNSGSISYSALLPMTAGSIPVFQPLNQLAMLEIDPTLLEFNAPDHRLSLVEVIVVTDGSNRARFRITNSEGVKQLPVRLVDGKLKYQVELKLLANRRQLPARTGTMTQSTLYLDQELVTNPAWIAQVEAAAATPETPPASDK